ncbi:hypothetical protein D910_06451 [Dendroctonus ponderosae]|uniref:DUF4817 domain-containing protein n=1 Tax=Dendroctonus ponderosae TaxID=77166 RepID=U4U5B0_DENPD|nr:hypothetical protein D910_06451 [Dendroctonus ponderosae]
MIFVMGSADQNCLLTQRMYAQKYPDKRRPSVRSLEKLKERFIKTGNINYKKCEMAIALQFPQWTVNVWGGLMDDFIVGSHFFHGDLNGVTYL